MANKSGKHVRRIVLYFLLLFPNLFYCELGMAGENPLTTSFMNVVAYQTDTLLSWYAQAMRAYPLSRALKIKAVEEAPRISGDYNAYHTQELPEILARNWLPFGVPLGYHIRGGKFYAHYGISLGDGTVLHKSGAEGPPEIASYRSFYLEALQHSGNQEAPLFKVIWENPLSEAQIKESLKDWQNDHSEFSVFLNNCEHFATKHTVGVAYSEQVTAWAWLSTTWVLLTLPLARSSQNKMLRAVPVTFPVGAFILGVERSWMAIEAAVTAAISYRVLAKLKTF